MIHAYLENLILENVIIIKLGWIFQDIYTLYYRIEENGKQIETEACLERLVLIQMKASLCSSNGGAEPL